MRQIKQNLRQILGQIEKKLDHVLGPANLQIWWRFFKDFILWHKSQVGVFLMKKKAILYQSIVWGKICNFNNYQLHVASC